MQTPDSQTQMVKGKEKMVRLKALRPLQLSKDKFIEVGSEFEVDEKTSKQLLAPLENRGNYKDSGEVQVTEPPKVYRAELVK